MTPSFNLLKKHSTKIEAIDLVLFSIDLKLLYGHNILLNLKCNVRKKSIANETDMQF